MCHPEQECAKSTAARLAIRETLTGQRLSEADRIHIENELIERLKKIEKEGK